MRGLIVEMYSSSTSWPTLSSFDYSWAQFLVGILSSLLSWLTPVLLLCLLGGWLTICARGHHGRHLSPELLGRTCSCKPLFVASIGHFISDHLMFIVLLLYCWFLFVWIGDNCEKFKWPMMQTVKKIRWLHIWECCCCFSWLLFLLIFMTVIRSIWTIHSLATPQGWWQRMDGQIGSMPALMLGSYLIGTCAATNELTLMNSSNKL